MEERVRQMQVREEYESYEADDDSVDDTGLNPPTDNEFPQAGPPGS